MEYKHFEEWITEFMNKKIVKELILSCPPSTTLILLKQ